jgi:3-ketosteroid 9alpha-monooxygenase subunit A
MFRTGAADVLEAEGAAGAVLFPRGWFQVGYSSELKPGEVVPLHYFGEELVLFRTERGRAQVFGAFCAHLGAHLGYGGTVRGDCLRCPFHAWEYDESGQCVAIPYSERIPSRASVPAWVTEERSGLIMVWHDPYGAPPLWPPPELPEFDSPDWSDYLCFQRIVKTSIGEVVENIFDLAHGQFVHENDGGNSAPQVTYSFEDHAAHIVFDIDLPLVGGRTHHEVSLRELGFNVNRATGFGSKAFMVAYTPIDAGTLDVHFSMLTPNHSESDPSGELSKRSAAATVALFDQDVPIWEHKRFLERPLLAIGDGPIGRYRKWAKQFYEASGDEGQRPADSSSVEAKG